MTLKAEFNFFLNVVNLHVSMHVAGVEKDYLLVKGLLFLLVWQILD